jgi:hypothetical protein
VAIKLIAKACLLLAIVASLEAAILLSPLTRDALQHTYLDEWHAKHELLRGPGHSRIILAGGSNVSFGIDSSKLQAAMDRETINLGLQGGLGLSFMLNELTDGVRAGDWVILLPEYEHFYGDLMHGEVTAAELIQYDWSALRYFSSWRQWRNLVKSAQVVNNRAVLAVLDRTKARLLRRDVEEGRKNNTVYQRGAYDEHGDMVAHLNRPSQPQQVSDGITRISGTLNEDAVGAIARVGELLTERGAEFVLVYPAVAASYWAVNRVRIQQLAARLPDNWTFTRPEDWVFDDRFFYDTFYHMNRSGRASRTERLAVVLRAARTSRQWRGARQLPVS